MTNSAWCDTDGPRPDRARETTERSTDRRALDTAGRQDIAGVEVKPLHMFVGRARCADCGDPDYDPPSGWCAACAAFTTPA